MADNALTKLSLAGQLGVSVAAALIIGVAFYYFYWSGAMDEERQKAERLETLRKEIRALEVTANKLQEFQREVAQLEAKLETLKRILPPEKETPDLMRKVQALASQSNLTIKNFTPSAVVNRDFYQEWPINMAVDGSYHNLGMFFDRVSRLSRLVNLGNLKIGARNDQTLTNTISAQCVATTFVYIEPSPPPPRPGAPAPVGAR
jgi:type IV pilus assembly protein PilO